MSSERAAAPTDLLVLGLETVATRAGGLNRYVEAYVGALREAGLVVELAAAARSATEVDRWLGPPSRSLLKRAFAARTAIRASEAPVVDLHFAPHAVAAVLGRTLRRRHVLLHFHGPYAGELEASGASAIKVAIARALERRVYRRASRCIVLSEAFAELLSRDYGVARDRIEVVPPGVDLERFRPAAATRPRGGRPSLRLVTVRRLQRRMGIELALEALALLAGRGVAAELEVVGAGPEREALEARARELGVTEQVRFAGFVPEDQLADRYREADLSLVPTLAHEGFGLIVLESLACGTPVVASAVGGLSEVVGGLDEGLLVPAGDAAALAERIEAAARGELPSAERCRAYAEGFTWSASVAAQLAAIQGGSRRLRVAFLGHHAKLSGGELAMARQLPAISAADVEVILGADGPLRTRLEAEGVAVSLLELESGVGEVTRAEANARPKLGTLLGTAGYVLRLARELRRREVDLLHTNTLKAALIGGVAARLARVAVVWHLRDRITAEYLGARSASAVRWLAPRLADVVVANSASTAATIGRTGRPVLVIASPLDEGVQAVDREGRGGPLRVGIVGRLASWKGQDLFLEAFAEALGDGDAVAVVVGSALFGEDAFAERLGELARELGLGDRVEFRGFREDVGAELARLDVLVHASVLPEPFGQVIVEGMASGLAVVASAAGGAGELVTNGVDGLLTSPGDRGELATALARLASDPGLRARLGAAGLVSAQAYRAERLAPRYAMAWSAAVGD